MAANISTRTGKCCSSPHSPCPLFPSPSLSSSSCSGYFLPPFLEQELEVADPWQVSSSEGVRDGEAAKYRNGQQRRGGGRRRRGRGAPQVPLHVRGISSGGSGDSASPPSRWWWSSTYGGEGERAALRCAPQVSLARGSRRAGGGGEAAPEVEAEHRS